MQQEIDALVTADADMLRLPDIRGQHLKLRIARVHLVESDRHAAFVQVVRIAVLAVPHIDHALRQVGYCHPDIADIRNRLCLFSGCRTALTRITGIGADAGIHRVLPHRLGAHFIYNPCKHGRAEQHRRCQRSDDRFFRHMFSSPSL